MINYLIVFVAVVLMSTVQLIVKYRFNTAHGEIPLTASGLPNFIFQAVKDPYLWFAGVLLVTAALLWYAMISRMSLGVVFSFAALSYPMIMYGSYLFLGENFSWQQAVGCSFVVIGVLLIAAYS